MKTRDLLIHKMLCTLCYSLKDKNCFKTTQNVSEWKKLLCSWELEGYVSVTVSVTVAPMMLLYFPK